MQKEAQRKPHSAPGRSERKGISLVELFALFPDNATATQWLESQRWPDGPRCPKCGGDNIGALKNARPMPYRCRPCQKFFSVRTGTVFARSHIPLQKWVIGIYLYATSLKGVSSMKLHRDLKITQKSAWFLAHRIRKAMEADGLIFVGPVEVDETYVGGKPRHPQGNTPRKRYKTGRGTQKQPVVGLKDRTTKRVRAMVVDRVDKATLHEFVNSQTFDWTKVYTDEWPSYGGLSNHEVVNHGAREYVHGQAHTNGIESFWAALKRGYHGVYHQMSVKHLNRYIAEFSGRQEVRGEDTIDQMRHIVAGAVGKRLMYEELVA